MFEFFGMLVLIAAQKQKPEKADPMAVLYLGLGLAAFCAIFYGPAILRHFRMTRMLKEHGTVMKAWIVQANDALYEKGLKTHRPALVLLSFPEHNGASDQEVAEMASQIFALRSKQNLTPLEEKVVAVALNETYQPGASDMLPREFTGGKDVAWLHFLVDRRKLPNRILSLPYVQIRAVRSGDEIGYEMIPYVTSNDTASGLTARRQATHG